MKAFSSQGILNRLQNSGKITQNTSKVGELRKKGLFKIIFSDIVMNYALFIEM